MTGWKTIANSEIEIIPLYFLYVNDERDITEK